MENLEIVWAWLAQSESRSEAFGCFDGLPCAKSVQSGRLRPIARLEGVKELLQPFELTEPLDDFPRDEVLDQVWLAWS